jgi:hypothetical protein
MAPEGKAAVLSALNQPCYFVCFFTLFVSCFVHNVTATFSYNRKELLDIRTTIAYLKLNEEFFFIESDGGDIIKTPDQAQVPVILWRRKRDFAERDQGAL